MKVKVKKQVSIEIEDTNDAIRLLEMASEYLYLHDFMLDKDDLSTIEECKEELNKLEGGEN